MRITSSSVRSLVPTLLLALTGALLVATAPTASAGTATDDSTTTDSAHATFGIAPAHDVATNRTVDGRPYLNYLATPGATLRDSVALINLGSEPLTLKVYATDAEQTADGAFGLLDAADEAVDAGSWIHADLPRSGKVVVPPRTKDGYGRLVVPIEVTVPADAAPGDHVGGVIASLSVKSTDDNGAQIKLDQRVGLRTYVRVSGTYVPKVAIENLTVDYTAARNASGRGDVTVTYDVHNTGNVRVNSDQIVSLAGWFGEPPVHHPATLQDMLPGSTIHVTDTFTDVRIAGRATALVSQVPIPVDPTLILPRELIQAETTFWAIPWPLLVLVGGLLLLLALIGGGIWRYRRRLKARRAAGIGRRAATKPTKPTKSKGGKDPRPEEVATRLAVLAGLVGVVGLLALVLPASAATAADSSGDSTDGTASRGVLFVETGQLTGDPARAVDQGWWGHEGAKQQLGTFISADLSDDRGEVTDASQSAWLKRFGIDDFDNVAIAFAPASKDGSTERPTLKKGETLGEAYPWFTLSGFGTQWAGTGRVDTDSVVTVSTRDEYLAWVKDGMPEQLMQADLVPHDSLRPGTPVSKHPLGASLLNRWPAGERISLVMVQTDGFTGNQLPTLSVGSDGRAKAAWLTFTTVASRTDPAVRTSAGYRVLGASTLPGVSTPAAQAAAVAAGVTAAPHVTDPTSSSSSSTSATTTGGTSAGTSAGTETTASATVTSEDGHRFLPLALPLVLVAALALGGLLAVLAARRRSAQLPDAR